MAMETRSSLDRRSSRERGNSRLCRIEYCPKTPSMATPLELFQFALQLLQLLPRLAELSRRGELLIVGQIMRRVGNQGVYVSSRLVRPGRGA